MPDVDRVGGRLLCFARLSETKFLAPRVMLCQKLGAQQITGLMQERSIHKIPSRRGESHAMLK